MFGERSVVLEVIFFARPVGGLTLGLTEASGFGSTILVLIRAAALNKRLVSAGL